MSLLTAPTPAVVRPVRYVRHPSGIYTVVVALFCGLLLISNIAATKLITVVPDLPLVGGIFTDGGALLFPLTYVLGDVLAEVYGLRQARRAIWVGFALAALASLTFWAVGAAPAGPGYENQDAFLAVLGFVPRIVVASLCGYLAGQFLNAYVLVRIKHRTRENRLWARLVGSTIVGEAADTVLFCVIAFVGIFPSWAELASYTVVGYFYKVAVEVIFLPLTYAVIAAIKRREPDYLPASTVAADDGHGSATVRQTRLTLTSPDMEDALRFFRDRLGLPVEEVHEGEHGHRVVILGGGRARLELTDATPTEQIDAGRAANAGPYRLGFEVDDVAEVTRRLESAGIEVIAEPTATSQGSLSARLVGPGSVAFTVFSAPDRGVT